MPGLAAKFVLALALAAEGPEAVVEALRQAVRSAPDKADLRSNLGYALLKIGETAAAREEFARAVALDPGNSHTALEYAFLSNDCGDMLEARRVFERIRRTGDPASRATAETAFQNLDRALAAGIDRWKRAVKASPDDFSAHRELAILAERRDDPALAAEHYERAWRLRPQKRELLLDLARVSKAMGQAPRARSALIAASRGAEPRTAETARELLEPRYPYVYEFRDAIRLDPGNVELRRELAYLYLEMGQKAEAEREFESIVKLEPGDLLSAAQLGFLRLSRNDLHGAMPLLEKVLAGGDEELADRVRSALKLPQKLRRRPETPRTKVANEARLLGERSFEAGYLKDALKYFTIANEKDPSDFPVMLKLGWTCNVLRQDEQAVRWFSLARRSPDAKVAEEAERAFRNLKAGLARVRTTGWFYPFFSSRWSDVFAYGQVKTEFRIGRLPFRPYLSSRFVGDTRRSVGQRHFPEYLSESSVIFGAGLSSMPRNGLTLWGEAGRAVSYLRGRPESGKGRPDYRGGLAYARGFGRLLGGRHGAFTELNGDAVFVSRFGNDAVFYSQVRTGYTASAWSQFYWNANVTTDRRREYWANYVESGPGLRLRLRGRPDFLVLNVDFLRGVYLINRGNPRGPNYYDIRAGLWYARAD